MPKPETPQDRQARHAREAEEYRAKQAQRHRKEQPPEDPEARRRRLDQDAIAIANIFGRLPLTFADLEAAAPTEAENREDTYRRELEQRREAFEIMCPPLFREPWNWELVKPEVDRRKVEQIFGWEYGPKGLYVAGESGHSKTRALWILARRLVLQERRRLLVLDGVAFSNLCTRAFGDPSQTEALLRPLVKADVLWIDDLAKRWTPATEEGAFTVLDRRSAQKLPVLVTINYSSDELYAMQQARGDLAQIRDVSTPLIRRLVDYCEEVVL